MSKNVRRLSYAAIAAAIVFVVTWVLKVPIPGTSGYINLGDSMIYFSAYMLGGPLGAAAASIGSALADLASGYAVYIPATFILKGLMGLSFGMMAFRKKLGLYTAAAFIGGAIMTVGYAIFETIVFGFAYAVTSIPWNLVQWAGGVIVALVLYPVAQRIQRVTPFDELQR
jgi:uncharacterized membrane protein